jgi:hypothetical protein
MVSSDEVNCATGQTLGRGWPSEARTPLQAKPAWASWSAVRALPKGSWRKTAGWPLRVVVWGQSLEASVP